MFALAVGAHPVSAIPEILRHGTELGSKPAPGRPPGQSLNPRHSSDGLPAAALTPRLPPAVSVMAHFLTPGFQKVRDEPAEPPKIFAGADLAPEMDRLSSEERSWNMSKIRGTDTAPELVVRSVLHRLGHRFRLHRKDLPGKPDIVLPKHKAVVFVHGCFWHRHPCCKYAYMPKTRVQFWKDKFRSNVERDARQAKSLAKLGWHVILVWECQTGDVRALSRCLRAEIQRSARRRPDGEDHFR